MLNVEMLYPAALLNALFQVVLLVFHRPDRRRANFLLAGLIGLIAISLWNVYSRETGMALRWRIADYTLWATPFLWMPTLYFYVRTVTKGRAARVSEFVIHYLPGVAVGVLQLPLYLLRVSDLISATVMWGISVFVMLALYAQMAGYFVRCFRLLDRYEVRIKDNFSDIAAVTLRWLKQLTAVFAILIFVDFALSMYSVFISNVSFYSLFFLCEAVAIFAIGYFSLANPTLLCAANPSDMPEPEARKYVASPLDDETAAELAVSLKTRVESTEIYKNNELRLGDLASMMQTSTHYLSQVINQECGKNFYDFVNEYRANYAAECLKATSKVNITKLAFDSGFNNRVSFNNAFKKYLGKTPTAYHREHWPR